MGSARENATHLREVPSSIQEHVGERAAHLARRAQAAVVIAPIEDAPAPPARTIHCSCQARPDALHPAGECLLSLRLDDEVRVIGL
jgi:hypothetical protein